MDGGFGKVMIHFVPMDSMCEAEMAGPVILTEDEGDLLLQEEFRSDYDLAAY